MEKAKLVMELLGYAVVGYFMSTVIHELGHVICGMLHKWKFYTLVVGPLKLYRENLNSKVKLGIEKNPALWGGYGGAVPEKFTDNELKIFSRVLLAGPIASIVLGVVSITIMILTKNELAMMVGFIALGEGIMCILPMKLQTGILYNDGTRFLRIVRGGQTAAEEKAMYYLALDDLINGQAEIYDEEMVANLVSSEDPSYKYYGLYLLYHNAESREDKDEMENIRKEMSGMESEVSSYIRKSCVLE